MGAEREQSMDEVCRSGPALHLAKDRPFNHVALLQIAFFIAAIIAADAEPPRKPLVFDIPPLKIGACPTCTKNKMGPIVAEGLSPEYSTNLPACDRIEAFLLGKDLQIGTAADRFPIRPDNETLVIRARKELKGEEASRLCSLWRGLTFDDRRMFMFSAGESYGLRFYRADKLLFETSVNFRELKFYYPRTAFPALPGTYSWHGFLISDEAGKDLLALLNTILPSESAPSKN